MKKYGVFVENLQDSEESCCITYGISIENIKIRNITVIRSEAEKLVDLLNHYDVSPIHFREIIEDFLEEKSSV